MHNLYFYFIFNKKMKISVDEENEIFGVYFVNFLSLFALFARTVRADSNWRENCQTCLWTGYSRDVYYTV